MRGPDRWDTKRNAAKEARHTLTTSRARDQERRWVEQAETAYARFVAGWNPRGMLVEAAWAAARRRVHCAHSSDACEPAAVSTLPLSQPPSVGTPF